MNIQDVAKKYAEIGWVTIPIGKNSKIPLVKNWSKITSTDFDSFTDDCNISVLMGKASNVICIDVDTKNVDGFATLESLQEQYGNLPTTVMSETPNGGVHYYFKYDSRIKNRKKIGEGIDVQADGTHTLESPSIINGVEYEWIYDPFQYELAELPKEWLMLLSETSEDDIELITPFEAPGEVTPGSRNNTIAQCVASMLGRKLLDSTILKRALDYNKENCKPPLDEKEVRAIVESMKKTHENNQKQKMTDAIKRAKSVSSKKATSSDNETADEELDKELEAYSNWYITSEKTDYIDEKNFAEWYVRLNQLYTVNGRIYDEYGVIPDDKIANDIFNIIGELCPTGLNHKVEALLGCVKKCSFKETDVPNPYRLAFNNVYFDVSKGKLDECDKFFTFNRIPHQWNPKATCPRWRAFLDELFYEEDIPVIQEYLGYCLVPNTLCQTSLFIIGEGGEGKSRITNIMNHVLGENNAVVGEFNDLKERFSLSSLEKQLLFIDDDISTEALDDTSTFKKIVTAETSFEVERKGVPKYKTQLYARILCCGNGPVTAKFDRSDGFYRRQITCQVKPLDRSRRPDTRLADKLKQETEGIINWLLEGLLRVVKNDFIITPSKRMDEQLQETKRYADTITQFFADGQYVEYTFSYEDGVSTKDMYNAYETFCNDNSYTPLAKSTFTKKARDVYKRCIYDFASENISKEKLEKILSQDRMYVQNKRVRGFRGVKLLNYQGSFTVTQ